MKYLLIVGDGMADYPLKELDNRTPLQAANKPNFDMIAAKGCNGLFKTIPEGLIPGSGTAILSVLGYDPLKYFSGRGPFEAAARNISINENDVAYRCNLVTEKNGTLIDYSADHITNNEAIKLIESLKKNFDKQNEIEFFSGLGYRHFLILRNYLNKEIIKFTPPHDAIGVKISKLLPQAQNKETKRITKLLNKLIIDSKKVLENHPVNIARKKMKKTFYEKYAITSAVISAVDLVKGIGIHAGMNIIRVPGATGLYDTNYEGKADYALQALKNNDMVFIHIEAPDEAGHSQDYERKIKTIEDIDKRLLGRILNKLEKDWVIAILPDHPTPTAIGTHTREPVPFSIFSPLIKPDGVKLFDEESAKNGDFGLIKGEEFMLHFLGKSINK
ncbi:MAG: cofactor-independent phosphoglycerate mutase [Candidatus Bathyarchaeota archaeon]